MWKLNLFRKIIVVLWPTEALLMEEIENLPYISVFRIAGRPILPPLVTKERRNELSRYRDEAVLREKRLLKKALGACDPQPTKDQNEICDQTEDDILLTEEAAERKTFHLNVEELSSVTATDSTDLAQFIVRNHVGEPHLGSESTPESPDATIAESLQSIVVTQPDDEETEEKPKRKNSFTLEAPSAALCERLKSMSAPLPGPDSSEGSCETIEEMWRSDSKFPRSPSPAKQAKINPQSGRIAFSPVISDTLTEFLRQPERIILPAKFHKEAVRKKLDDISEIETMLSEYHQLQVEQLKSCQQEEATKLMRQKSGLLRLLSSSEILPNETAENMEKSESSPQAHFGIRLSPPHICRQVPRTLKKRLASLVKGYLVRRLWKTERLMILHKTVKEALVQLESMETSGTTLETDDYLQEMINNQLSSALAEIHTIFFVWPVEKRMSLIEKQRCIEAAKRFKEKETKKTGTTGKQFREKRLSLATQKSLARKQESEGTASVHSSKRKRPKDQTQLSYPQRVDKNPVISPAPCTHVPRRKLPLTNKAKTSQRRSLKPGSSVTAECNETSDKPIPVAKRKPWR